MYTDLKTAHSTRGEGYLEDRLKYAFYGQVTGSRFTSTDIKNQQNLADLRYPSEWFPATRTMDRSIHMHVGPTNSGKTYHALKRLEAAGTGMYAGPLRLLAHEVYTRLNAAGKPCVLVTGEERRRPDDGSDDSNMISCTVEMMPMNKTVDVAVIDEIQMIGSPERGWAWTQALLGVKAHELHLCGEARTVPLVREICASIGEKVIVHEYERLSPLQMEEGSLNGNFSQLRKGDCIVSFSVVGIHSLRRQIERETGKKVATVYGSLPPETRAQQARLFNNPDNDYDYLVASDAIGMGLNLSIKRIIFEESHKFDGYRRKPLAIADIKQIGGRAGRYRSADLSKTAPSKDLSSVKGESSEDIAVEKVDTVVVSSKGQETPATSDTPATSETPAISENRANSDNPAISENPATSDNPYDRPNPRTGFIISKAIVANDAENATAEDMAVRAPKDTKSVGLVTTLEKFDFPLIAKAMESEPEPIRTAGIFPPAPVVERFAQYFPTGTPFSFIMLRLHELSQMHSRFHLCGLRDQLYIADLIEPVRNLTVADRITFCAVPASKSDIDLHRSLIPALARCIEQQGGGDILDIEELPIETLELELSPSRQYLRQLEQLHKGIIAYLWLSYRFAGIFTTRALAFHIKTLVEEKIERVLSGFSFTEQERQKERARKEKEAVKNMQAQLESENEEGADNVDSNMSATPSDAQSSNITGNSSFSGDFDMGLLDDASEDNGIDARDVEPKYPADGDRDQASRSFTDSAKDDGDVDVDDSIPDVLATDHETPESKDEDDEVRSDAALSDSEPTVDAESGVQHEADSDVTPLETQLEPPSEPPSEVDGAETERQEKKA
ncbi:hypothetical protein MBLNU457_1282t1 [Dothideomycetes sp. NU457]